MATLSPPRTMPAGVRVTTMTKGAGETSPKRAAGTERRGRVR